MTQAFELHTRLHGDSKALYAFASQFITTGSPAVKQNLTDLVRQMTGYAPAAKIALSTLLNTIMSCRDMLADGDTTWQKPYKKARADYEAALAKLPIAKGGGVDNGLGPRVAMQIKNAEQQVTQALTQRGIYIGHAPVYPMVQLSLDKLHRFGVVAQDMQGYVLLPQEFCVIISRDYVNDRLHDDGILSSDPDYLPTPKEQKKIDGAYQDVLASTVNSVILKNGGRLSKVSDRVAQWKLSHVYWLASPREVNHLMRSMFGGGHFAPTKWTLAFEGAR